MSRKQKLTKLTIDGMRYEGRIGKNANGNPSGGSDVRWDSALPGFGVRIFPSGTKKFVLYHRVGGMQRFAVVGVVGIETLDEARAKARRWLVAVRDGKDPQEEIKAANVKGFTVAELCDEFLERHAKPKKRTWRSDKLRMEGRIKPELGSRTVASVTRGDVATLHARLGKTAPYEANRVLALISKMWSLASSWGYLEEGAGNPARGLEKFKEEKRDRWLRPEELPRLLAEILKEPSPYVRAAIILYLLTGARKSELLSARWEDVDFPRRELRLPQTKANRVHHIPLSAEAASVLHSLPREEGCAWIFPSQKGGVHLTSLEKNWRTIRRRAKLDDLRIHDLRRTLGSWLAMSGASLPTIGKILNHSNASTTQIYARLSNDVGRIPLDAHGASVAGLAGEHAEALGLLPVKQDPTARA